MTEKDLVCGRVGLPEAMSSPVFVKTLQARRRGKIAELPQTRSPQVVHTLPETPYSLLEDNVLYESPDYSFSPNCNGLPNRAAHGSSIRSLAPPESVYNKKKQSFQVTKQQTQVMSSKCNHQERLPLSRKLSYDNVSKSKEGAGKQKSGNKSTSYSGDYYCRSGDNPALQAGQTIGIMDKAATSNISALSSGSCAQTHCAMAPSMDDSSFNYQALEFSFDTFAPGRDDHDGRCNHNREECLGNKAAFANNNTRDGHESVLSQVNHDNQVAARSKGDISTHSTSSFSSKFKAEAAMLSDKLQSITCITATTTSLPMQPQVQNLFSTPSYSEHFDPPCFYDDFPTGSETFLQAPAAEFGETYDSSLNADSRMISARADISDVSLPTAASVATDMLVGNDKEANARADRQRRYRKRALSSMTMEELQIQREKNRLMSHRNRMRQKREHMELLERIKELQMSSALLRAEANGHREALAIMTQKLLTEKRGVLAKLLSP